MNKRFIPREIPIGFFSNRKIVEFSFKLKNLPGVIAKISNIISKHKINILSGFHIAYPNIEEAMWSFFADFTNSDIEPKDLIEEIRIMNTTLDIKFNEAKFNNLIIDDLHFPLLVLNERSITLRIDSFANITERLYKVFGSGAATILYEMGMELGENAVKKTSKKYNIKGVEVLKAIFTERIAKGWGIPELEKFDEEKSLAIIKVYELFECIPFKGMYKESRSYFFKGYLAGILKTLFNNEVHIIEERCVAKGDPYCLFITK
jgi:predicted hydrocarbon binding protein